MLATEPCFAPFSTAALQSVLLDGHAGPVESSLAFFKTEAQ